MENTLNTRARIEIFFEYLFSNANICKRCYCGPDNRNEDKLLGEILKLVGAKQWSCDKFDFTNGVFHRKVGPCTDGTTPEQVETYWQEFIDEVASLVDK